MNRAVEATPENLHNLKKRMLAALAMLLVAIIMTISTSYAWLTLSIAPEVSGITSNVGSNGSLEIALLNSETYGDISKIKNPNIGESLSGNVLDANERWGNLINLNDASYGLQKITLYPARLNAVGADGSYSLDNNVLRIPNYGYDGRILSLNDGTVYGTWNGEENFLFNSQNLGYGVRAIGTTNSLSTQASYLIRARSNISNYTKSAKNSAITSLKVDGLDTLLVDIARGKDSFTNTDVTILKSMISSLQSSEDYIENALRQGLVAYAAHYIEDENAFLTANSMITNKDDDISTILAKVPGMGTINNSFNNWVNKQEMMQDALKNALDECANLTDNDHSLNDIKSVLAKLMNLDNILFNGEKLDIENMSIQLPITITLTPGSGVYADVADFAGNYTVDVGTMAILETDSKDTAYLSELLSDVSESGFDAAAGGAVTGKPIKIGDVYGYALDLAFRCNAAPSSDLLLQTAPEQRVYEESQSDATKGKGSYMEFIIKDTGISNNKMPDLLNAVRVAFVDNTGNILSVAKLDINEREVSGDQNSIKAPLYLYDYSIGTGEEAGKMIIGERRSDKSKITSLTQNSAKVITAIVWLDGDIVDNTMVSADQTLTGTLNLQFASSAELKPMPNDALKNYGVQ